MTAQRQRRAGGRAVPAHDDGSWLGNALIGLAAGLLLLLAIYGWLLCP